MTTAADRPRPIRVNRAPVLTLWAAVVAERLGHPPDTALTLGSVVAGTAARAKARRLGIAEEGEERERIPPPRREGGEGAAAADAPPPLPPPRTVRLLGRDIPLMPEDGGSPRALRDGRPQSPAAVRAYLARAFGDRLGEVRAVMAALAASLPPEEVNRVGFRLYERFRPEVPEGVAGWGAKAELRIERIVGAAG